MVRERLRSAAATVIALGALAMPAAAQITTGTITGTVKDSQGAVIPGAAVTLTSETRGTHLSDVFTNENGDFTFVNVPPDRYKVEIKMTGFKPAQQTGISVSPGDRLSVGVFTIEVGGSPIPSSSRRSRRPYNRRAVSARSSSRRRRSKTCRSAIAASPSSPSSHRASPRSTEAAIPDASAVAVTRTS